ncbi:extracellular calcium-sensing receptor-like [Pholidichthys leucotaenia]
MAVKLPDFWLHNPAVWFIYIEAQFALHGISVDDTRYHYVVALLISRSTQCAMSLLRDSQGWGKYAALKKLLASVWALLVKLLLLAARDYRVLVEEVDCIILTNRSFGVQTETPGPSALSNKVVKLVVVAGIATRRRRARTMCFYHQRFCADACFSSRALRWMQTMTFTVNEINQRSDLLPQLKLGFHIRDSCDNIPVSLRASFLLVNGQPEASEVTANNFNTDKRLHRNKDSVLGCAAVQKKVSSVIIGDASSGVSLALLRSLGSFHIPLVSYFASCSCLSDQQEFPTFMRTMPSDAFQIRALTQLVSYFNWTWVGIIGVESDYARFAIQLFLQESVQCDVCAAYTHIYPVVLNQRALDELLDVIQMSSARVIINFSSESEMQSILRMIQRRNVTGLQWIASEAWATAKSLWETSGDLLIGTLGFAIRRASMIPGLKQHLTGVMPADIHNSAFLAEFWEEVFNCRWNESVNSHTYGADNYPERLPCKGTEDLNDVYSSYSDVTQLRVSYNVYKAVYLVAHALQDMSSCNVGKGPFSNGTCADPKNFEPFQLLHYMKQVNFSVLGEKVNFDQNGDPIAYYDLVNWQRRPDGSLHLVKVGFYDASLSTGHSLGVYDSVIQGALGKKAVWSACSDSCPPGSRIVRRKGEPICCYDCVLCTDGEVSNKTNSLECLRCSEDSWPNKARDRCILKSVEYLSYHDLMGILLCVVSIVGACISFFGFIIFLTHKDTPLVRANNMELSFLLLVFLAICFLIVLLFIGEPSDWLCRLRYPAFGVSFALCISCLLTKTAVVLMAFRSTLPGRNVMKWFGATQQRATVVVATLVQVIICLIWLVKSPPHASNNADYHRFTIIVECVAGSQTCFWCVIGYIGFLACVCLLMAFLARRLPDNFNEARIITFSMLIFFAVWITFIPVYMSTTGKYTVAVHIFAILASAFGLLFCIFVPKCYIILFQQEKNTKRNIMQR